MDDLRCGQGAVWEEKEQKGKGWVLVRLLACPSVTACMLKSTWVCQEVAGGGLGRGWERNGKGEDRRILVKVRDLLPLQGWWEEGGMVEEAQGTSRWDTHVRIQLFLARHLRLLQ